MADVAADMRLAYGCRDVDGRLICGVGPVAAQVQLRSWSTGFKATCMHIKRGTFSSSRWKLYLLQFAPDVRVLSSLCAFAMADLVGVAGLTFAIFDKVWLIGCKTAEVVSDYREFDKVSEIHIPGGIWLSAANEFSLNSTA